MHQEHFIKMTVSIDESLFYDNIKKIDSIDIFMNNLMIILMNK